jgi:hypothetical protein
MISGIDIFLKRIVSIDEIDETKIYESNEFQDILQRYDGSMYLNKKGLDRLIENHPVKKYAKKFTYKKNTLSKAKLESYFKITEAKNFFVQELHCDRLKIIVDKQTFFIDRSEFPNIVDSEVVEVFLYNTEVVAHQKKIQMDAYKILENFKNNQDIGSFNFARNMVLKGYLDKDFLKFDDSTYMFCIL